MTFADAAKRKYIHITNPAMKGRTNLYVFDNIDTLYDIIRDDRELQFYIRHPIYRARLERDDWREIVKTAYARATQYDNEHPTEKRKTKKKSIQE